MAKAKVAEVAEGKNRGSKECPSCHERCGTRCLVCPKCNVPFPPKKDTATAAASKPKSGDLKSTLIAEKENLEQILASTDSLKTRLKLITQLIETM